MKVELREMTIADYDEVYALWRESEGLKLNSEDDSRQSIKRFLERNPGLSYVALDQGKVVGAALCGHDGRHGYIHNLAVRKSHRRQGIGRSLVGRCMYALMNIGIHRCHLFVLGDNQGAIAFWRKLGWEQRVELITMSQPLSE
ncbi:MAG: GNAT family N-acetyltransferase [Anaerolineae bacterium]|nr:MAG: GNAT family N-acetyltransferase [Anaerolineae bacterium]